MTTAVDLFDLDVPTDAPVLTGRQHPKRDQALELIRAGCNDHEVQRQLRMDRGAIRRIRRQFVIPPAPLQPLTVEQKWQQRVKELPGGHLEWTGSLSHGSGTPILHYKGQVLTAAAIAFRLRTGRGPVGYVLPECDLPHCVAPRHVDDAATRLRDRQALRDILQMPAAPDQCANGHDQAQFGRRQPDGVRYCHGCKLDRKHQDSR
ncbi:hypothetical protein [Streptacidiphilus sp. MAP5-52]|uniref:hypothetical protein n=1 Tax=Streptacidiphilus sp. MAP5-52 TaxID=3156267 RepID=UPI0035123D71